MRITSFLISSILLTLSLSVNAKHTNAYTIKPILSQNSGDGLNDSTTVAQQADKNIYKLIISGKEEKIRSYFKEVTADELLKADSGAITKAFKRVNTNDKVTRTIWILEEVKKRDVEIRAYVYNELLKVDFGKPSFFLNHMINNYFTNYPEKEATLSEKVRKIHGKMNR